MTYVSLRESAGVIASIIEDDPEGYPLDSPYTQELIRRFHIEYRFAIEDKKHQFITVALPTETTDLDQLKKRIQSLDYKYLDGAYLTVEYFSGELKKRNLHIHILKTGIYNKSKLIRDMSRKFKVAVNFVNVKKSTKESDYQNRLNYINGEKISELKKENCDKDREWRDQNGFQHIYNL